MFTGRFYFCDWKHHQLSFHIPGREGGRERDGIPGCCRVTVWGTAASCPAENRKKSAGRQIFILILLDSTGSWWKPRFWVERRMMPVLPGTLAFNGLWSRSDVVTRYILLQIQRSIIEFSSASVELSDSSRNTKNELFTEDGKPRTSICSPVMSSWTVRTTLSSSVIPTIDQVVIRKYWRPHRYNWQAS